MSSSSPFSFPVSLSPRTISWLATVEHVVFVGASIQFLLFLRRRGPAGLVKSILSAVLTTSRAIPGLNRIVDEQLAKEVHHVEEKMLGDGDKAANFEMPERGLEVEEILRLAKELRDQDHFESGKKWAGIYHDILGESSVERLHATMWDMFQNTNGLFPAIFKSTRKFEAEIVQMAISMLHGDSEVVGLLTSGGTESILLAVLAYREMGRERGIEVPEIICSRSAHPALDKAAFYFGLKIVKAECDLATLTLLPEAIPPLINKNTVAVYTSAPSFSHGTVDPIEQIAAVTRAHNLGLHVDNCLGGFLLSFLQKAGYVHKNFDFLVDGVTTISVDIHKNGMAPKGVSAVLFRNDALRRLTLYPVTTGLNLYVSPTLQGSRGQGIVAAAWATMMHLGQDGYLRKAIQFQQMKEKIESAVASIPGLYIPVVSDCSIVPIASRDFNIYSLSSLLEEKGWTTFSACDPPLFLICLGDQHLRILDDLLADIRDCAAALMENPNLEAKGVGGVYSAMKFAPDEVLSEIMKDYIKVTMTVKPYSPH